MMSKKLLIILFLAIVFTAKGQINEWVRVTDINTQTEFSMPANPQRVDTLSTTLYATPIDSTEALQVHIFNNAYFDSNNLLFSNALIQESGDTLRAVAKLMVLLSNSEVISMNEIYTNGHRGLELGIKYLTLQNNTPYSSFIRYYLDKNNFISFSWTGNFTNMRRVPGEQGTPSPPTYKDAFFNSIEIP